jgi:thiamine biosynthesis lipoprotein
MVSVPVTLARQAMATRFEIVLHGENPVSLRAAGEEAFDEIERIEGRLSLYRASSEIAHLNARAAHEPVRVSPAVFRLLAQAASLSAETNGVFDITIGPLMKCWGFVGGGGQMPTPAALAEARARVGMHLVELDSANHTVRFARSGVFLDLGAIGKGYALGVAAELLREAGVTSALIHGGTSSVYAIGTPPDAEAWKIAIEHPAFPPSEAARLSPPPHVGELDPARPQTGASLLAVVPLRDEAFSVSAVWGKSFQSEGKTLGHVLDPRSGAPVERAALAAVVMGDSTEADALSTALLIDGSAGLDWLRVLRPAARALVLACNGGRLRPEARGIDLV